MAHLPIDGSVSLDLNKDGLPDFQFARSSYDDFGSIRGQLNVYARAGGAVVGSTRVPGGYGSALLRGAKMGPSANFNLDSTVVIERSQGSHLSDTNYSRHLYGKWGGNASNRFLDVKFLIHGAIHYGWVRLTVITTKWPLSATITDYAYETVANKRILAGVAPTLAGSSKAQQQHSWTVGASLGMLASGAERLAIWRRDETLTS